MINWLFEEDVYPKFLFATPQFIFGGCGIKASFEEPPTDIYPLIGFRDFFPFKRKSDLWNTFPDKMWIQPNSYRVESRVYPVIEPLEKAIERKDFPDKENYTKTIEKGFEGVEKIVLARKTLLKFSSPLEAKHLINNHLSIFRSQDIFFFMPEKGVAFMGATPERLYERKGDKIFTAAIAGTLPIDQSPTLLFESKKDLKEHQFVVNDLKEKLMQVCEEVKIDEQPTILTSHHLFHLKTFMEGTLKKGVEDRELIELLHPTSAVAGYPKVSALEKLYHVEPFDRGLYAAPFALIMDGTTLVSVAIRSILLKNDHLYLFAGSGLVEGSTIDQEWNELNHKISPYLW
ncbi:MAG: isochorismate synthase [Chlamydiae bacterium]|nr:isochorismate synthase [Chlamydiota bacterium]